MPKGLSSRGELNVEGTFEELPLEFWWEKPRDCNGRGKGGEEDNIEEAKEYTLKGEDAWRTKLRSAMKKENAWRRPCNLEDEGAHASQEVAKEEEEKPTRKRRSPPWHSKRKRFPEGRTSCFVVASRPKDPRTFMWAAKAHMHKPISGSSKHASLALEGSCGSSRLAATPP